MADKRTSWPRSRASTSGARLSRGSSFPSTSARKRPRQQNRDDDDEEHVRAKGACRDDDLLPHPDDIKREPQHDAEDGQEPHNMEESGSAEDVSADDGVDEQEDTGEDAAPRRRSWLPDLSGVLTRLFSSKPQASPTTEDLRRLCGSALSQGFLLTPDCNKFQVRHSALDYSDFKPKVIEELHNINITTTLNSEDDLVSFDTCKSSFGYELESQVVNQTIRDKDGHSVKLSVPTEPMQGVINIHAVPLIQVMGVPERKARLSTEAFDTLEQIEGMQDGPAKEKGMEKFLCDYGSHFHIGGTVKVGAVLECVIRRDICEEEEDDDEDHDGICLAIFEAAKTNCEYVAEMDAWTPADKFEDTDIPSETLSKYSVKIQSFGDLPGMSNVQQWREDVLRTAECLPVVNKIDTITVGIWDLIAKEDGFEDAEQFADQMKATWKKLAQLNSPTEDQEEEMITDAEADEFQDSYESMDDQGNNRTPISDREQKQSELNNLLEMLDIKQYFPGKLQLQQILMIKHQEQSWEATEDSEEHEQQGGPLAVKDVVPSLLDKLIGIDYRCRDKELLRCALPPGPQQSPADRFSSHSIMLPHPQDVLLLAYQCSDPALQQLLASKMSICRLAIPFVLPSVDDKLTVAMWPLRKITVEWTGESEKSFTKHAMHVVSFLRLGTTSVSKSKTINNILSSDIHGSSHNTFFHRALWSSGMSPRNIANGLVEMSHFIPSEGQRTFKQELVFLNLRGDGAVYRDQRQFLSNVSATVVICIDVHALAEQEFVTELADFRKTIKDRAILFLTCDERNIPPKELLNSYLKKVDSALYEYVPTFHYSYIGDNVRTENEIREELRKTVTKTLRSCEMEKQSLEDHLAKCTDDNIRVDEDVMEFCKDAKLKVHEILKEMLGDSGVPNKKLLPLQGAPWMKWTKLLKAKNRPKESTGLQAKEKIQEKMDKLRHEQWNICRDMPKFLAEFIGTLITESQKRHSAYLYFFCRWMMIELDNLSRKCLPEFKHAFEIKQRAYDECPSGRDKRKLWDEVVQAEEALYNAGIGMEHFMRELGQVYECIFAEQNRDPKTRIPAWASDLPGVTADLLMTGFPLEIMNGDTGCVPIEWIKNTLNALEERMGGKKLFVLSCIGIQSSGKSTLLNAMFGLEFAVGAGRVSRGIFAQLLHVDKSQCKIPCDLVLVLDTEGLRAPQRASENYANDNELATLVVGLADLTLVNIKGENTTVISDVLEIVVHAFLRMREANPFRHKKKQKCMFLHQNVTAVNATEKMSNDHRLLRQNLDEKIRIVAKGRFQVSSFSDIIQFDGERHAWYFYDLWAGNPPMAPANPQYAEKAKTVKKQIFEDATECRSLPDLGDSLQDLWKAVLADDFVFSFRNNMAAKAYLEMDTKCIMLNRQFQSKLQEWTDKECRAKIQKINSEKDLANCVTRLKKDLDREAETLAQIKRQQLKDFFEKNSLKDYMVHLKEEKLKSMEVDGENVKAKLKSRIDTFRQQRKMELRTQITQPNHEKAMMKKATDLAERYKGQQLTDQQINTTFNELWNEWADELTQDSGSTDTNIVPGLADMLWEQFTANHNLLEQEWRRKPLSKALCMKAQQLENTIVQSDIKDEYFHQKTRFWKTSNTSSSKNKRIVLDHTNHILRKIDAKLDGLLDMDTNFFPSIATELLDLVLHDIDQFNDKPDNDSELHLTMIYKVMLANHVIYHSIPRFELLNRNHESRHGVRAQMEAYKAKVHNLFRNQVLTNAAEVKAADLFCDSIFGKLIEAIDLDMSRKVVDAVLEEVPVKYHLIVNLLDELTTEEKFIDFMDYIEDPKAYASRWVKKFTKELIFRPVNNSTMYINAAKQHIKKLMDEIKQHATNATKEARKKNVSDMSGWLDIFCDLVPDTLFLPRDAFGPRNIFQFNVNINGFQQKVMNRLDTDRLKVLRVFEERRIDDLVWKDDPPYDQVMEQLWGCGARCPFCHEPCQKQEQHQEKHHCIQHRPCGARGCRGLNSRKLVPETCSFLVTTGCSFNCGACDKVCQETEFCNSTDSNTFHPYREYHKYMPAWDIAPDNAGEASQYWQWFMCKYNERMAEFYNCKPADIPASWHRVTKEKALASLRQFQS